MWWSPMRFLHRANQLICSNSPYVVQNFEPRYNLGKFIICLYEVKIYVSIHLDEANMNEAFVFLRYSSWISSYKQKKKTFRLKNRSLAFNDLWL